jgi:hypothetical protein
MEVTKWLKPSESASRIGDGASVQAVTRVNAEQASKRTMRRSTRQPFRGRLIRLGEVSEAVSQKTRIRCNRKYKLNLTVRCSTGGSFVGLATLFLSLALKAQLLLPIDLP